MGFFILACGMLVMVSLYDSAMRHTVSGERRYHLSLFGEEVVEAVRDWALDPNNYLSAWTPYDNDDFVDTRYPGVVANVRVVATGQALYSPFVGAPQARTLDGSVVPVRVETRWQNGREAARVILMTYICEPPRPGLLSGTPPSLSVSLTAGTDPLPADQTMEFDASLLDNNGQKIKGVVFQWEVVPSGPPPQGNALIASTTYEGDKAQLTHHYPAPVGFMHVPGGIRVRARARYGGKEFEGESGVIQLQ
jgi:hypothetical protein